MDQSYLRNFARRCRDLMRRAHSEAARDQLSLWAEEFDAPKSIDEANARLAATTSFWRAWVARARVPDHRWRPQLQRSALAIKGLTYMPTGATVAALTTSLPETPATCNPSTECVAQEYQAPGPHEVVWYGTSLSGADISQAPRLVTFRRGDIWPKNVVFANKQAFDALHGQRRNHPQ